MHTDEKDRPMVNSFRHQHKITASLFAIVSLFFYLPDAKAEELPFKTGEKLVYNAKWLFMDAGRIVSHITDAPDEDGSKLMRFNLHTKTTNLMASIWTMDDNFDSFWDVNIRAVKRLKIKIRESTYKKDKEVFFDHENGTAISIKNEEEPKEFKIKKGSNDFFTAGHFARTFPLEIQKTYYSPIFEDDKSYDMAVKAIRKKRINIMGGKIDTILAIVKVKFEGAFRSRGELYVWFSDDKYKAPVQMRLDSFFGSVVISLVEYEGVDLTIIRKE